MKQFSSFDVAAIVRELRTNILDYQVSNIYQLDAKTLLFKFRQRDKPVSWLVIEAGKRIHLTSYSMEKPRVPPTFCMALRKYLRNSWLMKIQQHNFERVLLFAFKTWAGSMKLSIELFGDGNVILVDQEDKILHAMQYKRMRDRAILRGKAFCFAPPMGENPLDIDARNFSRRLRDFGDVEVVKALAGPIGIGGLYAEEVLLRANVEKTTLCNALNESESQVVSTKLRGMLNRVVDGELQSCTVSNNEGSLVDVVPFQLERYKGFVYECYNSFNQALDEFYVRVNFISKKTSTVDEISEKLELEADRFKRMAERQSKALVKAEADITRNKNIGDAIYAKMGLLQTLVHRFLDAEINGKKWDETVSEVVSDKKGGVVYCMVFNSFDSKHMVIDVTVDGLTFDLSLRNNLYDNAASYYQRYKRSKRKLEGIKKSMDKSHNKLKDVERKIETASESVHLRTISEEIIERKIKRKKWFEKFRWFRSSDSFLIVGGKDAVSNEVLVKKHAEAGDIVLHADLVGAPFIVIKTEGKRPSDGCLQEASVFAAAFSRGWREGFASVDVYWVNPNQLTKAGPSGEYVPPGAFAVRGTRNWMRGAPLSLAVGITEKEDTDPEFIGGPISAVDAVTDKYVGIGPGDLEGKNLFRRILKTLSSKLPKERRERVLGASVEEIRAFVPYSKGRLMERKK